MSRGALSPVPPGSPHPADCQEESEHGTHDNRPRIGKDHLTRHRYKDQIEGHLLIGFQRTVGGIRQQTQESAAAPMTHEREPAPIIQNRLDRHQVPALRHPANQGISAVLEQQRGHVFFIVLVGLLGRALVVGGAVKRSYLGEKTHELQQVHGFAVVGFGPGTQTGEKVRHFPR